MLTSFYVYIHFLAMDEPEATVDLSACRRCHCLEARRTAREITRLYEDKLRPHDLRATQFSILAALALEGPTPVGDLAGVLGLERTSLSRSADVLERNGWVDTAEAEDARKRPLELTAAGRQKVEEAYPAWREAQDEVGRRIDDLSTRQGIPGKRGGR